MHQTTLTNNRVPSLFRIFFRSFPSLFLFELVFRGLSLFLLRPAGSALIAMMLEIGGDEVLFNYQMLKLLFTMPGIAAIVLILCLSSLFTYFEFSVIYLKLYSVFQGTPLTVRNAMKLSMTTFMSISNWGILGYFVYSVLLLPFESVILRPSILPALQIPNFITGEFSKRWYGVPLLNLGYLLLFLLFLALLFVIPAMIFRQRTFFQASADSLRIWRNTKVSRILSILLAVLLWILLFLRPGFLNLDFSGLFQENMLKTLCMVFLSGQVLGKAALALAVWILKTGWMILFCTLLLLAFFDSGASSSMEPGQVSAIDQKLRGTRSLITGIYLRIRRYFRPLFGQLRLSPRAVGCVVLACILGTGVFLYRFAQAPPYLHKPLTIGHRGSNLGVENTLEGVEGAIRSGADFVELDIQLSGDQIPVAMHDDNLSRLAGESVPVRDLTAAELSEYELRQYGTTGHIPTLEELMRKAGDQVRMLLEFKASARADQEPLVRAVLALIEKYEFEDRCILMSLDYDMVSLARNLNPDLKIGYCMFGNLGNATVTELLNLNVDFVVIEENMVNKDFVTTCRRAWLPVYVWTVNEETNMEKYLDWGVIGLISDKPYAVKEILESRKNETDKSAVQYYWGGE